PLRKIPVYRAARPSNWTISRFLHSDFIGLTSTKICLSEVCSKGTTDSFRKRFKISMSADGIKVHKLAVYELPRSGKPEELLAKYGLDAAAIVKKVKALV